MVHATLQPHVPPRELPDEVLPLPRALVAVAAVRRGEQRAHRRLRPRETRRGFHHGARTHHVPRGAQDASQARHRGEADARGARRDARHLRRRVLLPARAREQRGGYPSLRGCAGVRAERRGGEVLRRR